MIVRAGTRMAPVSRIASGPARTRPCAGPDRGVIAAEGVALVPDNRQTISDREGMVTGFTDRIGLCAVVILPDALYKD